MPLPFPPRARTVRPRPSRRCSCRQRSYTRLALEPLEDRTVPSTIQGTVFDDVNANGARDGGEPGLAGVSVFLDSNGNGATEPQRHRDLLKGHSAWCLNCSGEPLLRF